MPSFHPLTHAEKRIYLTQKMHPESSMWNVPTSFRLPSGDGDLLFKAVQLFLKNRRDIQVRFRETDGIPQKYFSDREDIPLLMLDFSDRDEKDCMEWMDKQSRTPMPMLEHPLHFFAVLRGTD